MNIQVASYYERIENSNGSVVIDATSRARSWSRDLSPFLLGPCDLYDGYRSKNMENGWQFAKVYLQYTDADLNPTPEYFRWAKKGWRNPRAIRYPMGKNAIPIYSWWKGQKFSYIEARKHIYIPLYSKAVVHTRAFEKLQKIASQYPIIIRDFDGYDHKSLGMTLNDVINCPTRRMGHAFVLAMMLETPDQIPCQ